LSYFFCCFFLNRFSFFSYFFSCLFFNSFFCGFLFSCFLFSFQLSRFFLGLTLSFRFFRLTLFFDSLFFGFTLSFRLFFSVFRRLLLRFRLGISIVFSWHLFFLLHNRVRIYIQFLSREDEVVCDAVQAHQRAVAHAELACHAADCIARLDCICVRHSISCRCLFFNFGFNFFFGLSFNRFFFCFHFFCSFRFHFNRFSLFCFLDFHFSGCRNLNRRLLFNFSFSFRRRLKGLCRCLYFRHGCLLFSTFTDGKFLVHQNEIRRQIVPFLQFINRNIVLQSNAP